MNSSLSFLQRESSISALIRLGKTFRRASEGNDPDFAEAAHRASMENPWFTPDNIRYAAGKWGETLTESNLRKWAERYPLPEKQGNVLLVLAGNLPLVGLHDVLCTYLSGHKAWIKPSKEDTSLIIFVVEFLRKAEPDLSECLNIASGIIRHGVDAVIATGSDNTARYFDYYFEGIPSLLRHSRYSVGIIDENTSEQELSLLADDMLLYFGLGCRSVSQLLVPQDFDLTHLCRATEKYSFLSTHHKYRNNYDYRRAIETMAGAQGVLDTGFLLLTPREDPGAPVGTVGYRRYLRPEEAAQYLDLHRENIQCVVGREFLPFGSAQSPALDDYADGADTMEFLLLSQEKNIPKNPPKQAKI